MSANQQVSAMVMDGTQLVQEAQSRHKLSTTATAALGRALIGGALMASSRGDNETLQFTFACDGDIGVSP
jgi:molecular chaperone Hsp33